MMNYLWSFFILISLAAGIVSGNLGEVSTAAVDGAKETVEMLVSIAGVMCFWTGMMEIAVKSGLTLKIQKLLDPITKFLFPGIRSEKAKNAVLMNVTANILGIGNAATPLGLKAMEELEKENFHKGIASDSMCRFVLLNTASIQIVPTTVFALRSAAGSKDPFIITPAVWISSVIACIAGFLMISILEKRRKDIR